MTCKLSQTTYYPNIRKKPSVMEIHDRSPQMDYSIEERSRTSKLQMVQATGSVSVEASKRNGRKLSLKGRLLLFSPRISTMPRDMTSEGRQGVRMIPPLVSMIRGTSSVI